MKFKEYKDLPELQGAVYENSLNQIFKNRGFNMSDVYKWIEADMSNINDWRLFDNIEKAVDRVSTAIGRDEDMCVIVDSDTDGMTSSAAFINYFFSIFPEYVEKHVSYVMHKGKGHGLSDTINDIPEKSTIVICPDAGSNDIPQFEILKSLGKDIVILDHHHADVVSDLDNVILVNNQTCDYPNKHLSGAGVVWQFCRAYDELFGFNSSNYVTDLAAVGNAADMMDYRSLETRALIDNGLKKLNNNFIKYLALKNEFAMNNHGGKSYMGVAFGIANFINSICRTATMDEKDFVFKGMLDQYAHDQYPCTTKGHSGEIVDRFKEAYQICVNVKRRQTNLQNESVLNIERIIDSDDLLSDKVLVVCCSPDDVEKNIAGLAATKLQQKYQRPCMVLIRNKTVADKEYFYRGSLRDYEKSDTDDFRKVCEDSNLGEYFQGHAAAAGASIPERNIQAFRDYMNEYFSDTVNESVYWVDYLWNMREADYELVLSIGSHPDWWSSVGMPEPLIGIKDIDVSRCKVQLMGKNRNTIKFVLPNGLCLIKFGVDEDFYNECMKKNKILTIVGTCNANEYLGNITPQIKIVDLELTDGWIF